MSKSQKPDAVDRFISMLDDGLARLAPIEQQRVLCDGAQLLDTRRARLSKPEAHASQPEGKLGRIRAAR
jgi:hypothetical protein